MKNLRCVSFAVLLLISGFGYAADPPAYVGGWEGFAKLSRLDHNTGKLTPEETLSVLFVVNSGGQLHITLGDSPSAMMTSAIVGSKMVTARRETGTTTVTMKGKITGKGRKMKVVIHSTTDGGWREATLSMVKLP